MDPQQTLYGGNDKRGKVRLGNNKATGFVSYGRMGGARAAEHLRLIAGELQMADVRQQVALSLFTEFENFSVLKPSEYRPRLVRTLTAHSC